MSLLQRRPARSMRVTPVISKRAVRCRGGPLGMQHRRASRQKTSAGSLLQGRPSSRLSLLAEAPNSKMTPRSMFHRYSSWERRPSSRAAQLAAQGALPPAQRHRRALCSQQEKGSAVEPCPLYRACLPGWPTWQQKRGGQKLLAAWKAKTMSLFQPSNSLVQASHACIGGPTSRTVPS